jgi:hypothetical protein
MEEIHQFATYLPNGLKIYQMAVIYIRHIIYQLFSFQGPQQFTQIWIFGLKTYYLATQDDDEEENSFFLSSS